MGKHFFRGIAEVSFIIFLFYANLLMGEMTRSRLAQGMDLMAALRDIATVPNFCVAVIASLIGYLFIEFWRKMLQ